jgi:hypothetical protein
MSKITEKRSFNIPPCLVDKDLVKKVGELLEKEYELCFKEVFEKTKMQMQEEDYYKKYPKQLTEDNITGRMQGDPSLGYLLRSNSRNIDSANIASFAEAEWPDDANEISMELNSRLSAKNITLSLYLTRWRMKDSEAKVSGVDSTWVNGITVKLDGIFMSKRLSYHPLVTHASIRYILSLVAWGSLSFAFLRSLWPWIMPYLKESTQFEELFILVFVAVAFPAVFALEAFLNWLFPQVEYGKGSASRRVRGWIWGLLVSSGIIAALFLKLFGL